MLVSSQQLNRQLQEAQTSSDASVPQLQALYSFLNQNPDRDVSWLDFVLFMERNRHYSYEQLFCKKKPLNALSTDVKALFEAFYLSYPPLQWETTNKHEVNCFYPGNLEPVAEQESLYTSSVYYTPTDAEYQSPYHLPVLYSTTSPFQDQGPQAHSAHHIAVNSFNSFNPVHLGIRFFCDARRQGKKVTVTPGNQGKAERDPYHYIPQFWRMSLGQESDIRSHQERVALAMANAPENTSLLLYGVSRGAATTFTSLAHAYQQSKNHVTKVSGVILEAPFNCVAGELEHKAYFNSYIIPKIMEHNPDGITPANQVQYFPPDVPVLFITSKVDKRVPITSTSTLAASLSAKGQNRVYVLTLDFSDHPSYLFAHPHDRYKYLTTVHAFRRSCNLAYDVRLADLGENYLKDSLLIQEAAGVGYRKI